MSVDGFTFRRRSFRHQYHVEGTCRLHDSSPSYQRHLAKGLRALSGFGEYEQESSTPLFATQHRNTIVNSQVCNCRPFTVFFSFKSSRIDKLQRLSLLTTKGFLGSELQEKGESECKAMAVRLPLTTLQGYISPAKVKYYAWKERSADEVGGLVSLINAVPKQ